MRRLIYYSLALPRSVERQDLIWQLESSIRSLRTYNPAIDVRVFVYGDLPDTAAARLAAYDVTLHPRGDYGDCLAAHCPRGWPALVHYPLLHKFLNFTEIAALDPNQVLFLDCDTLFFADPARLFDRYGEADCYAREEPTCRRSPYGYDPAYLDEDAVAALGQAEGVRTPPPFNLGAVLFNHGVWRRLAALAPVIVDYAWRFHMGMAVAPMDAAAAGYGESPGVGFLRRHLPALAPADERPRALPYPSANQWICDQFALWFALGHLPDLRYGDFSARDVLQNGEFLHRHLETCDWVLCHYYTQNMARLDTWIREYLTRIQAPTGGQPVAHAAT